MTGNAPIRTLAMAAACALALAACHDRQADAPAATQASADQAAIQAKLDHAQAMQPAMPELGKGLGDHKDAFKASLDQFDAMANGDEAKVGAQGKAGCSSLTMGGNAYLSSGREIALCTENGSYRKEAKAPSVGLVQSQERRDAGSLLQHYDDVVSALNVNQC